MGSTSITMHTVPTKGPVKKRSSAAKHPKKTATAAASVMQAAVIPATSTEKTTMKGQMALNPEMTKDEARIAAKKEYHRLNAAASRRRQKNMVECLKDELLRLTELEKKLEVENQVLKAKTEILEQQQASRKDQAPIIPPPVLSQPSLRMSPPTHIMVPQQQQTIMQSVPQVHLSQAPAPQSVNTDVKQLLVKALLEGKISLNDIPTELVMALLTQNH